MPGKLSITVGLPGSGKTTKAKEIAALNPLNTILVSRDDLRFLLYNGEGILDSTLENYITKVQKDIVKNGLKAGKHVIVHDMNLRPKYRKQWAEIARDLGAEFNIIDCTQVPVAECMSNDQHRFERGGRRVGKDVILSLSHKFKNELKADVWKPYKLYPFEAFQPKVSYEKVEWEPGLPKAIIVDIDGTVADCTGVRNPYDETKYHLDKPKEDVIRLIRDLHYVCGYKVIFVSGRHEDHMNVTEEWLYDHVKVPIEGLFMRYERGTEDSIIKAELFNRHIRGQYDIVCVFDDRDRVVEMWRGLGLFVNQVQKGEF
jgi:tRNA uridine 5-carbamoylmethylation protein Kti12